MKFYAAKTCLRLPVAMRRRQVASRQAGGRSTQAIQPKTIFGAIRYRRVFREIKSSQRVPEAIKEVWHWKEKVYEDTVNLTTREALKRMGDEMEMVKRQYGLNVAAPSGTMIIAEDASDYTVQDYFSVICSGVDHEFHESTRIYCT